MQRYFVPNDQFDKISVRIVGDDAKHIQRVMRMTVGDHIICCNENAKAFLCEIEEFHDYQVNVKMIEDLTSNVELPVKVIVVQALPKGDKLDYIVQKGTELGASSFVLFQSERSIVKWDENKIQKKLDRVDKIVKEAAEQSHRLILPKVSFYKNIDRVIEQCLPYKHKIVAYEEEAKQGKQKAFPSILKEIKPQETLVVLIGPEGGLTSEEVDILSQAGFTPVGLGRRILRTETAALYVLSAVSYQFELLNEVN